MIGPHILIAEDDADLRQGLIDLLEAEGYRVTATGDGAAALAAYRADRPDLLLLDVMMPGLDGFAVAQRVRLLPALQRVPIIFVTARDHPTDMIKGIQVGARNYLTKPLSLDDLHAKVKKAVAHAR